MPVYAIELLTESAPLSSVESLAGWVLELINTEVPDGAVTVGGHSLGARVATQVSILLEQLGRKNELTILIDDG